MKKTLFIIIVCSILMIGVFIANAAGIEIPNPLQYDTIGEIITAIADFIALLGSSIAVIMIIWAGIVYMTAGDNKDKVESAKKTIQWALIGVAIIWSAKFLIDLVEWVLGKT